MNVTITVNGEPRSADIEPRVLLVHLLRDHLGLTGTHWGCDTSNCGACGTVCPAGQVCASGSCSLSCQAGLTNCSGTCSNTQTDNANCGACNNVCPSGQVCASGACVLSCQTGLMPSSLLGRLETVPLNWLMILGTENSPSMSVAA